MFKTVYDFDLPIRLCYELQNVHVGISFLCAKYALNTSKNFVTICHLHGGIFKALKDVKDCISIIPRSAKEIE